MTAREPTLLSHNGACVACFVFVVLLIAIVTHAFYYWPHLPPVMAVHFDAAGQPNGWSSRSGFYLLHFVIVGAIVGILGTAPLWMPRLPPRFIRLPPRHGSVEPQGRAAAVTALSHRLAWFANAQLVLDLLAVHLVVRYNLGVDAPFDSQTLIYGLIAFGAFIVIWLLRLRRSFTSPVKGSR